MRYNLLHILSLCAWLLSLTRYFAKVRAAYKSQKQNELEIAVNQLVIVRSVCINGWCYAESLDGGKGYIPFLYVLPLLPSTDYIPEWQALLSIRDNKSDQNQSIRLKKRDVAAAQRRSRMKAISSVSYNLEG